MSISLNYIFRIKEKERNKVNAVSSSAEHVYTMWRHQKYGATLFATVLQRHVTLYQFYIYVAFITEMEVFVVVFYVGII